MEPEQWLWSLAVKTKQEQDIRDTKTSVFEKVVLALQQIFDNEKNYAEKK